MSLVPPVGQPDWSTTPARLSGALWTPNIQNLGNGVHASPTFDVSEWTSIYARMVGQQNGASYQLQVNFYIDAALTELANATGVIGLNQTNVGLWVPITGRYLQITADVEGIAAGTISFRIITQASTADAVPGAGLGGNTLASVDNLSVVAGGTAILDPVGFADGAHTLMAISDAATWTATVFGFDVFGVQQLIYIQLNQGRGIQGIPYDFTVGLQRPQLQLFNGDGVARHFWANWSQSR